MCQSQRLSRVTLFNSPLLLFIVGGREIAQEVEMQTAETPIHPGMKITPLDNLALDHRQIFDELSMDVFLQNAAGADPSSLRQSVLTTLEAQKESATQSLRKTALEQFSSNPFAARTIIRSYAYLADGLVRAALKLATRPQMNIVDPVERFAVLAVGGFGRAEMAEHPDIDLLFLVDGKIGPWIEHVIENVLYLLWDLKLKVGHSCRTAKDCIRLGREDFTIRTALLENRVIFGDETLAEDLNNRLWHELFKGTGRDFVEAKLAERDARNTRQNGNRYLLEPNVKEGKGGLRDLQTLFWIFKYLHRIKDPRELIDIGACSIEEFEKFISAEAFLWSVRCVLHILAGKAQDKLNFEVQAEVARALGYQASPERSEAEHFMQEYFRYATDVGELTRIFLTALEAQHVKREPLVRGLLTSTGLLLGTKIGHGYKTQHGRLAIADDVMFLADKRNILRLFDEALRTGLLLHPDAMRLVSANLFLIDDEFRRDPENSTVFFNLLLEHGNPERALRRMNELGVLGRYLPEFQNIVAMTQPGGYHQYTVDEHTIQCISTLSQIERGEYREELPVASEILDKGVNRKVLYLALLLHDIGKGSGQDHSVYGAEIARQVASRLGLNEADIETVEWLVRHHLLMSDTCQKRDISDPRTLWNFALRVASRSRLKLLTVLTVCDIRGVGPGIWTNWKAQLLRDLFRMTHQALTEGRGDQLVIAVEDAKARFSQAFANRSDDALAAEFTRYPDPFWQNLTTETQVVLARLLEDIRLDQIRMDAKQDPDRDATRICFALADHPGSFARIAGALSIAAANVVDAKTYTTSDGYAVLVFWVQDQNRKPYGKARFQRLSKVLEQTMKGEVKTAEALEVREKDVSLSVAARRTRSFAVPTEITFDNEGSDICTILEVDTRDRPGLMFDIAYTLFRANVTISSAIIATYGIQAVDVFYIKDMAGHKLYAQSRMDSLRQKLMERIARTGKDTAPAAGAI